MPKCHILCALSTPGVAFPFLEWKSHTRSGKVGIANDAVTTKPNLGLATNSREWRGLTQREKLGDALWARWPSGRLLKVSGPFLDKIFLQTHPSSYKVMKSIKN